MICATKTDTAISLFSAFLFPGYDQIGTVTGSAHFIAPFSGAFIPAKGISNYKHMLTIFSPSLPHLRRHLERVSDRGLPQECPSLYYRRAPLRIELVPSCLD